MTGGLTVFLVSDQSFSLFVCEKIFTMQFGKKKNKNTASTKFLNEDQELASHNFVSKCIDTLQSCYSKT